MTEKENVFLFSVTDSGKGIKKQAHSKIFSTFYQGDISATREHGGAGLGLALRKRLIDTMEGSIDFETMEMYARLHPRAGLPIIRDIAGVLNDQFYSIDVTGKLLNPEVSIVPLPFLSSQDK